MAATADNAVVNARPRLAVDGEDRRDLAEAVTALVVNLPYSGCGHAELVMGNFGRGEDGGRPDFLFQDVDLGQRIEVRFGEAHSAPLFTGEVTGVEERYGDGAPQLHLLLQDRLHRLARNRRSRVFEDQSAADVLRRVAGDAGLETDVSIPGGSATWHQLNESDLAFMLRLAGRFDIGLRLDGARLRARPESPDTDPIRLDAQDNALRVRLVMDLNHQPSRSRVLGLNVARDNALSASADRFGPGADGETAADVLGETGWNGAEVVPLPVPRAQVEADALAQAHFDRRARDFVSGELRCIGEPGLASGREVELSGVSRRLTGKYRVMHCVHRFDGVSGYESHLRVQRADRGRS